MAFPRILVSLLVASVVNTIYLSDAVSASVSAPTYQPIVADNFEAGTIGTQLSWTERAGPTVYDSTRHHSGSKSIRLSVTHQRAYFGGRKALGATIGDGETIWYRAFFYFPSSFSFSSAHNPTDDWGFGKFMVLDQANWKGPRQYLELPETRYANYGDPGFDPPGIAIAADGSLPNRICSNYKLPRDRWVALQIAWHVSYTPGQSWVRLWSDDTFICEQYGTTPAGYVVAEYGIGNYWNGSFWVQGASTNNFWMDDVVLTKQTPNTIDSEGHPFIHPSHFVGSTIANPIANPMPPAITQ